MKVESGGTIEIKEEVKQEIKVEVLKTETIETVSNGDAKIGELNNQANQLQQKILSRFDEVSNVYEAELFDGGGGVPSTRNEDLLERGLDPLVPEDVLRSSDRQAIQQSINDSINQHYDEKIEEVRNSSAPRFEKEEAIRDLETQRQEHLKGAKAEFDKNYQEAMREVNSDPSLRNLPPEDKQAIAAERAANAWNDRVEDGEKILNDLKTINSTTDQATLDRIRQDVADYFGPAGMRNSHQLMEAVRREGSLDNFLTATLRDKDGNPPGKEITDAVKLVMQTGRLDVYAETLATTAITLYDPSDAAYNGKGFNGNHVFFSGDTDLPRGVYINQNSLGSTQDLANVMAHELFHAYNEAHGNISGALNEGFGIAAREYAFSNGDYNLAEMVYGTKNFYRDIVNPPQPDYPLGDASVADPELRELMTAFASRDSSQLAWDNNRQLQDEYTNFFEPINRNQDWNDWLAAVEQATNDMLAAR